MIRGVLFDMDGVLVDSEEYICNAAIMMFEELGIKAVPEDFKPFTGMGENRYIGGVAEYYKIPVDIEKVKARTYECLAVTTSFRRDELKEADWICGSLHEVPEEVIDW